jgi:predicted DNA-binding protein (UPF0251 family)/predicted Fe-Mo cluster-binding NifX family protein
LPRAALFKPAGIPARELERLRLTIDELEAIRLVDREGLSHEQAAEAMGVSRQTVGRVLERGRAVVAEALTEGKAILIDGGQYRVTPHRLRCRACETRWLADDQPDGPVACPRCGSTDITTCWGNHDEGVRTAMTDVQTTTRIAIPSDAPGGLSAARSGHFGRCACFTMVDIVDGQVAQVEVLDNAPHVDGGCMSPVMSLAQNRVDAVVVDGIGGRPLAGFNQVGIAVHRGSGADVSSTVSAYLAGDLPIMSFDGACQH